ncbi:MAG: murein L,D-transpeptidase family protein [Hyphomicrobiales bacterium]
MSAFRSMSRNTRRLVTGAGLLASAALLSACYGGDFQKENTPIPSYLKAKMSDIGVGERDGIFIRIFKKEAELEVWKRKSSGKYALLKTYEICAWSGDLGPKFKEGDRQAPEGFYRVTPGLMNPNSSFHLAFNLGFPNAYDRSRERTGSFLMVHGACSSAGCYSMEDAQIEEIYAMAREAFLGGQKAFQVHAFPYRMTAENMAIFQNDKHMPFWRTLKRGYEHFELTGVAPKVDSCNRGYVFNAKATDGGKFNAKNACPAYEVPENLKAAVDAKISRDKIIENQIASGFTTDKDRKHAELVARLNTEEARIDKFKDRGLAYSSHMKRRLVSIQKQLVALGYKPDGSAPSAPATDAVQTGATGAATPASNAPTPAKRPGNAA